MKELHLPYAVDKTNASIEFTRNRVRRRLLPMLARDFNPGIGRSLSNLRQICGEAQDYLEREGSRAYARAARRRSNGRLSLEPGQLGRLHPAILRQVILKALETLQGDLKQLDHEHIAGILDLLRSPQPRMETHLPGGLRITKRPGALEFSSQVSP